MFYYIRRINCIKLIFAFRFVRLVRFVLRKIVLDKTEKALGN